MEILPSKNSLGSKITVQQDELFLEKGLSLEQMQPYLLSHATMHALWSGTC